MSSDLMKVLHVIGPLRTGGAQTQLLGLIRAAHMDRWDATIVATSGGALSEEFSRLGCRYIELRRRGSPGLLRMRAVRRIVAAGQFDVIHGNLWQSNVYARVSVARIACRPAVVISERNVELRRSRAKRVIDRALASLTDAYVGNTDAVTTFVKAVHPTNGRIVTTIPNAVDTSVFYEPTNEPRSPPVRIGAVGRLDDEKGFDVLIEAAKRLCGRVSFEIEIVGEGPERAALADSAAGLPVRLLGSLDPGQQVADFLRSLNVFVMPSRYREGRPNAVLEAVATGLPVVATAIPGMEEIFGGPTLVPPGDPQALAESIIAAATNPHDWIEQSRIAPVRSFDELARDYRQVFEDAISHAMSVQRRKRPDIR